MAFDSLADFLAMGGRHGPFVWSAYGITFAVLLWNLVQPVRQRRHWLREQAQRLRRSENVDN